MGKLNQMYDENPYGIDVYYNIGTYTFTADEIIKFANKFDRQYFHTDKEAAKNSMFGALCASGWHTGAIWMRLQLLYKASQDKKLRAKGLKPITMGPSPGLKNIKWFKPVFAGDTIQYGVKAVGVRKLASKPGWSILNLVSDAYNQHGDLVMSFDNAALVKTVDDDDAAST